MGKIVVNRSINKYWRRHPWQRKIVAVHIIVATFPVAVLLDVCDALVHGGIHAMEIYRDNLTRYASSVRDIWRG